MLWVIVVIFLVTTVAIAFGRPSEVLQEYQCGNLPPKNTCYKLLDIRDALDFEAGHMPGAVNISLGRLPYLANKDLEPEYPVIIVGKKDRRSKKAARILKKQGFHQIYVCVNTCS